jgi:hypothetical protein
MTRIALPRVLSTLAPLKSEDVGQLMGLGLCCCDHAHQGGKSLSMDAPALRKRERLIVL